MGRFGAKKEIIYILHMVMHFGTQKIAIFGENPFFEYNFVEIF